MWRVGDVEVKPELCYLQAGHLCLQLCDGGQGVGVVLGEVLQEVQGLAVFQDRLLNGAVDGRESGNGCVGQLLAFVDALVKPCRRGGGGGGRGRHIVVVGSFSGGPEGRDFSGVLFSPGAVTTGGLAGQNWGLDTSATV